MAVFVCFEASVQQRIYTLQYSRSSKYVLTVSFPIWTRRSYKYSKFLPPIYWTKLNKPHRKIKYEYDCLRIIWKYWSRTLPLQFQDINSAFRRTGGKKQRASSQIIFLFQQLTIKSKKCQHWSDSFPKLKLFLYLGITTRKLISRLRQVFSIL
jgi:hypothetical protein